MFLSLALDLLPSVGGDLSPAPLLRVGNVLSPALLRLSPALLLSVEGDWSPALLLSVGDVLSPALLR